MPPGISREHAKKRKTNTSDVSAEDGTGSETHDNSHVSELVAGRQRRSAAMKTHKVWDQLKPGGTKHQAEGEEEAAGGEGEIQPVVKRMKSTPKPRQHSDAVPEQQNVSPDSLGSVTEHTPIKLSPQRSAEAQQPQRIIVVKKSQPAMDKQQLEMIEREMEKHNQLGNDLPSEPSDDEEDDEEGGEDAPFVLDDPHDQDFIGVPTPRGGRRGRGAGSERGRGRGRGRGSRGGAAAPTRGGTRGRPRGSRMVTGGGGIMRGRMMGSGSTVRIQTAMYPPRGLTNGSSGIYSLQPTGGIVGELPPFRPSGLRIIRPRAAVPTYRPLSIRQPMAHFSTMEVNRELENFRGRIVEGSSVEEFNNIIEQLLQEISRVVADRNKLVEYADQLNLTHQAAQEIKDNRIRQLEQSLEQMQHKKMASFKQEQLQIVKQGSTSAGGPDGKEAHAEGEVKLEQQQQQGQNDHGDDALFSARGPMHLRPAGMHFYQGHQQSKFMAQKGAGVAGQQLQMRMNMPFEDEDDLDMDDEEFDEDDYDGADIDDEDLGAQVTI